MPAAPAGTITQTLCDGTGTPVLVITVRYNPVSLAFDVNPPIHVVNSSGHTLTVSVNGLAINVPVGTRNVIAATLAALGITDYSQVQDLGVTLVAG